MTQSDFIVKFFDKTAPHQTPGDVIAGSVRALTPKGHQFIARSHHCLYVTSATEQSVSDLWTHHPQLGRFLTEAVEARLSFAIIQS